VLIASRKVKSPYDNTTQASKTHPEGTASRAGGLISGWASVNSQRQ
jgi:hypothetical protein